MLVYDFCCPETEQPYNMKTALRNTLLRKAVFIVV